MFCFFFLLLTSLEQPFHPGWPRGGVGVPPWPLGVAEGTLALCRGDISRDVPMAPDTHPPPPGTNQARPCAGGKTPRSRVWGSDSVSNKIPEFSRSSPQGGVGIALRAFPGGIWAGKRWAVLPWERAWLSRFGMRRRPRGSRSRADPTGIGGSASGAPGGRPGPSEQRAKCCCHLPTAASPARDALP